MDAERVVIDSTVFIEFLRLKQKKETALYRIADETEKFVSSVTVYELFIGARTEQKRKDIELLIGGLPILSFTYETAIVAADIFHELYKDNKLIEFRDIFIAAVCRVHNIPVLTSNTKHFERINGIIVIDSKSI